MPYIVDIFAKELIGLNGIPSIEVEVQTESDFIGRVKYENKSLNPVEAIKQINQLAAHKLIGYDVREQLLIDKVIKSLDLDDLSLVLSMAILKAACAYTKRRYYETIGGVCVNKLPRLIISLGQCNGLLKSIGVCFNDKYSLNDVIHYLKELSLVLNEELNFVEALSKLSKKCNDLKLSIGKDVWFSGELSDSYIPSEKKFNVNNNKLSLEEVIKLLDTIIKDYQFNYLDYSNCKLDFDGKKAFKNLQNKLFNKSVTYIEKGTITELMIKLEETKLKEQQLLIYYNDSCKYLDEVIPNLMIAGKANYIKLDSLNSPYTICTLCELIRIEEEFKDNLVVAKEM